MTGRFRSEPSLPVLENNTYENRLQNGTLPESKDPMLILDGVSVENDWIKDILEQGMITI